jgi:hypothetical protein
MINPCVTAFHKTYFILNYSKIYGSLSEEVARSNRCSIHYFEETIKGLVGDPFNKNFKSAFIKFLLKNNLIKYDSHIIHKYLNFIFNFNKMFSGKTIKYTLYPTSSFDIDSKVYCGDICFYD